MSHLCKFKYVTVSLDLSSADYLFCRVKNYEDVINYITSHPLIIVAHLKS
jgi:hypothetical protein